MPAQSSRLIGKCYWFLQLLATWVSISVMIFVVSLTKTTKIQTYEQRLQFRYFFSLSSSFVYGFEKKLSTSRMRFGRSWPDDPDRDSESMRITSISFSNPLSSSTSGAIASDPF